ncbi:MAG: hypothetical protein PHV37_07205 [Candidatus Gastranaerophilales bacterium]|nr:hypothetical protein [Candidatus Gastranaerophilales bacterium]
MRINTNPVTSNIKQVQKVVNKVKAPKTAPIKPKNVDTFVCSNPSDYANITNYKDVYASPQYAAAAYEAQSVYASTYLNPKKVQKIELPKKEVISKIEKSEPSNPAHNNKPKSSNQKT